MGARNNSNNSDALNECNVKFIPLDISNINSINDALDLIKPNIIIHAAATKFVGLSEKFLRMYRYNILGH